MKVESYKEERMRYLILQIVSEGSNVIEWKPVWSSHDERTD
jgi:hypothetical protein